MKRPGLLLLAMLLAAATPALAQKEAGTEIQKLDQALNRLISVKALSGMWWRNPQYVSTLGLTPEQQKQMDGVFQAARVNLIDLKATLEKEEVVLEPLLETEQLDEAKVLSQIDRVANARAELEKGNARMLLGLRRVLTAEQWSRVYAGTDKASLKANLKKKLVKP